MIRTWLILFFFIFCFSAKSDEKIKIIENFNKIKNISFDFNQTTDGKTEQGNCTIEYPKKIYCSYKLRYNKILVSNGKSLVIKSDKINQYYYYPLKSTPFDLLLDKKYILDRINNSKVKTTNEKYYYFLINNNNYEINVFFDKKNYNLVGWQTEDIYQNLLVTFIYNLKINTNINKKLFVLPKKN